MTSKNIKMYTIKKGSEVLILDSTGQKIGEETWSRDTEHHENWFAKEAVCSNPDCKCPKKPFMIFHHKLVPFIQTDSANVVVETITENKLQEMLSA